ncbi:ABC transporter ATP-binding protein [Actinomadura sp. 9N215]|uniref:ABC transporter ATP-binding protein n=1 Tax=Actinomadura sp. 9N215 TaxID=3375150 RepID=UPI0037AD20DE
MPERTALRVAGMTAGYDSAQVVRGIDFDVPAGRLVTLLGPSGCGKTTTLRCVAGLHRVSGGSISVLGETVAGPGVHVPPAKRGLNMVFQSYAIWPHMTVFQNVAYGLKAQKAARADITATVREMLELVGLPDYADRSATDLSGGQQQRVVLARALATRPRLLLLDEPLSNLDAQLRVQLRGQISEIQRSTGTSALYVTHDQAEALSMSDTIVLLRDGLVEQIGTPEEVYHRPATVFAARFIGGATVIPAVVTQVSDGRVTLRADALESAPRLIVERHAKAGLSPGDEVDIALRPEAVRVHEPGETPEVNGFPARIRSREFLGNRVEMSLRSGRVTVRADLRSLPGADGDEVIVSADPARMTCIPRENSDDRAIEEREA